VRDDERERLLAIAEPHMRLWILLCSDLALRSGTAARLCPEHYDPISGQLTITTKYGAKLRLPVTEEIEALLRTCDLDSPATFVRQLWVRKRGKGSYVRLRCKHFPMSREWRALLVKAEIKRRIVPHDLRRTTAVAMLRHTQDVRDVQALLGHRSLQATIWYLDHDLRPVSRATLELIKRPRAESDFQTA
jgi:integrase